VTVEFVIKTKRFHCSNAVCY